MADIDYFAIDYERLCHEVYDRVYREQNRWDLRSYSSEYRRLAQQTQQVVDRYTTEGEAYLINLRHTNREMFNVLKSWTSEAYKELQDILRGGQRSHRNDDPKTLYFTVTKTLSRYLNNIGLSYFFRRERRRLYRLFFSGFRMRQYTGFQERQLNDTVIQDVSSLLQRWNDVIYRAPRFSSKVIMYRGFAWHACDQIKRLRIGERFTEHGYTSLSICYGVARFFASKHHDGEGYIAAIEVTQHTPICWIEPISLATNPHEYEGLLGCGAVFEMIGHHYFRIVGYNRVQSSAEWLLRDRVGLVSQFTGFGDDSDDQRLLRHPDHKKTFKFSGNPTIIA